MSMLLMVKAMHLKVGNPMRKLVLIKLADNANDSGECWPSYQHIADQCEIGRSTVKKHIRELEKSGFLNREFRRDGELNKSNIFHLSLDGALNDLGHEVTEGGARGDLGGGAPDNPRTSHSLEPVIEPVSNIDHVDDIDAAFETFWEHGTHAKNPIQYGLKRVNKSGAKKSFKAQFNKLPKDFFYMVGGEKITGHMAFALAMVDDIDKRCQLKQYGFENSLHPTTYLNNQRWTDDYADNRQENNGTGHKLNRVEAQNQRLLEKYGHDAASSEREINPINNTGLGEY